MFVEKRENNGNVKYYLVHSYRENNKVKKIRKYLGVNLSKEELKKVREKAKKHISGLLEELNTEIFKFKLTKNQIRKLNKYSDRIKIIHLDKIDWKKFEEDFVYNTNAIEGSTVEYNEVKNILENKEIPKNIEEVETKNVAKALKFIRETKEEFSLPLILKLHKICFQNTKEYAGKFRNVEVVVKKPNGEIIHKGVSVKELKASLNELVEWYYRNKSELKPLVLATVIHNQFEYIHPFQDGNGRVGRLLLNFVLLKNKYPPINILLKDRQKYYLALKKYSEDNEVRPTLKFLISQYKKNLRWLQKREK